MLTEKEIEEAICKALGMEVWSSTQERAVLQVRGDWGQGAKEAAAAIATRLSEGVVWEATGQAYVPTDMTDVVAATDWPITIIETDEFKLTIKRKRITDYGQLVEVTVKIVEGTKE